MNFTSDGHVRWNTEHGSVEFDDQKDGRSITFRVTAEALGFLLDRSFRRVDAKTARSLFFKFRPELHKIAMGLVPGRSAAGPIPIRREDLRFN